MATFVSGTATITAGNTSVTVTHALGSTPTDVLVSAQDNLGGFSVWCPITERTSTQFTIHIGSALMANITFDYIALL